MLVRDHSFDTEVFLKTEGPGRSLSKYSKNQIVYSQGDAADSIFYIQGGKVKVCVVSEQGKEAVIALHEEGDFFGEGCLNGHPLRTATVKTVTDCVIMRFEKATLNACSTSSQISPSASFRTYWLGILELRRIRVDQLFNSSEKRLARVLLLMANFGKEGKPGPNITNISQETLAEMVGTTRSRISFFMNRFRKLGFVEYNGDVEVHNSLLNVLLHDKPHLRRRDKRTEC